MTIQRTFSILASSPKGSMKSLIVLRSPSLVLCFTGRSLLSSVIHENFVSMSCSGCHLDLRTTSFIVCAECTIPRVCMCILCFTGKYTTDLHSPEHDYFVISGGKLETIEFGGYSTGSVLALIDSTRRFSIGSWREVSNRSRIEDSKANEHVLMQTYRRWQFAYSSDLSAEKTFAMNNKALLRLSDIMEKSNREPIGSDFPGYIDRRCDFDVEYDDSAELIIADLEMNEEDPTEERAMKLECLRGLTARIERRELTKEFTRGNRLLKIQSQIDTFRAKTAEEVEVYGKLRPLRRFFDSSCDADAFNQVLLIEKRLRSRIATLETDASNAEENKGPSTASITPASEPELVNMTTEGDGRPVTRSKSLLDHRRLKLTDSEMNKVLETLVTDTSKDGMLETLTVDETTSLERFGLARTQFAVLKGCILKKMKDSFLDTASVTLQKFGSSVLVRVHRDS